MTATFQITPAYPPDISGVGDYAALLGMAFERAKHPIRTLVARPEAWGGNGATSLERPNARDLGVALRDTDRVLLHFSGYGYARRGLCRWLVDGLTLWKEEGPGRRLVTMFHEGYATGPIWRSSFWTAALQRRIARDLLRLSDAGFVSSRAGHDQLRPLWFSPTLEVLPVFSNMGEPEHVAALVERHPLAVVFGGAVRRERVYAATASGLGAGLARLEVDEIIDIGPASVAPRTFAGRPVRVLGALPEAEVSRWLSCARVGLIDYPRHVFTKSGIAAACFAHGVLVVNTSTAGRLPDDLVEGRDFVTPAGLADQAIDPQAIAAAGRAWYRPHGLAATSRKLAAALS